MKDAQRADGLTYWCRLCVLAYAKNAWRNLSDEARARKAAVRSEWYRANAEKQRAYAARWRAEHDGHRSKWTPEPKERVSARQRAYRAANPAIFAEQKRTRRAALMGVERTLTDKEWGAIVDSFGRACAYCLRVGLTLEQDHVLAISKGGAHAAGNIVPSCKSCNSRKGNRGILSMLKAA